MIILMIWVVVLIASIVLYLRQIYSRFHRYGVKYETPIPLLGNMSKVLLRKIHYADDILNLYKKYSEERFVGRYEFYKETLIIRDVDLIKQITVKDFEHFLDHVSILSDSDSFVMRNLFFLKGQQWKDMRSTLSPAFTSSKIRLMVPFMIDAGDQMMMTLKEKLKNSNKDYIDVDCKDLTTRHANDTIASCAFGLKVNSHKDIDNQFYTKGKELSSFGFKQLITMILMINVPAVTRLLKWDILPENTKQFFKNLVLDTMKNRELKHIMRPDMIHLLMEAKKGQLKHEHVKPNDIDAGFATVEESTVGTKKVDRVWTDEDLIAQAMIFFAAGFETVSSGMSFMLYELAVNPDVQDQLAKEIREQDAKNGGQFDFTSIQNMSYLDMVISEVLRLWPPAIGLDRECKKDYNLGKPNKYAKKDFIIRKGTGIGIPVYAIHRDPQYFPNPEKFDPERFSDENKHKINSFVYMPFGVGPRNCIGSRFALCEMKAIAYQILLHWEISPSPTTRIPAKLSIDSFNIKLDGGHELRFRLRT